MLIWPFPGRFLQPGRAVVVGPLLETKPIPSPLQVLRLQRSLDGLLQLHHRALPDCRQVVVGPIQGDHQHQHDRERERRRQCDDQGGSEDASGRQVVQEIRDGHRVTPMLPESISEAACAHPWPAARATCRTTHSVSWSG